MSDRGPIAAVATALLLVPLLAAAQSAQELPTPLRTPDGHPDLGLSYDHASGASRRIGWQGSADR